MSANSPATPAVAVRALASLKWHLLLGGLRGGRQQRVQTVMAVLVSAGLGVVGLLLLWGIGRGADIADDLIVVLLPVIVFGVGLLSASAGVESSIDARHLASEPIGRWTLGIGMLAAAAVGPPTLLSVLSGAGIVMGWSSGGAAVLLVGAAVVAWWCTLLLFSRTARASSTNCLSSVSSPSKRKIVALRLAFEITDLALIVRPLTDTL